MLTGPVHGATTARCETCREEAVQHTESRAIAILRFVQDGWLVSERHATWCPACAPAARDAARREAKE